MTWNERVLIRPGFWTREACARVRRAMDCGTTAPAEVYDEGYVVSRVARRSLEVDVDRRTLTWIHRALIPARVLASVFFGVALDASEGAGLLRYPPGGFYRPHRDVLPEAAGEWQRQIAVVIFLNSVGPDAGPDASPDAGEGEPFGGGELRLHPDGSEHDADTLDIVPRCGTLVAFPAARLHEVLPVTLGTRDAVVDWFA